MAASQRHRRHRPHDGATVDYFGFNIPRGEADFLWGIAENESGQSYSAVNKSSGALGKYQVLPSNVAEWTREALGHSLTPSQYLADPQAQDAVAVHILGNAYQHHGVEGAASIWYTGAVRPASYFPGGANTETVGQYANNVLAAMKRAPAKFRASGTQINSGGIGSGSSLSAFSLPTSASDIPGWLGQHIVLVVAIVLLILLLKKR